jgi:uncharacterized protein YjiS (DUF1127 family)
MTEDKNEKKTETTPTTTPPIGNGEKPKKTGKKEPERIETTPILKILPTHTDTQIEARYMGYVQGVKATASKTVEDLQKKAAEPVGKEAAVRAQAIEQARTGKAHKISDIERRMTKARQKLDSLRRRLLSDAGKEAEDATEAARKAFKSAVRPIEDGLEVAIRAVANDAGIKINAASAEFEPLFKAAVAKRIEEERKAKEAAEQAKKIAEEAKAAASVVAANDNAEKPLVKAAG